MKPTDKITVEITLAELAKIYAVMAHTTGTFSFLYALADEIFKGAPTFQGNMEDHIGQGVINYHLIEEEWLDSLFPQDPELQKQKRIRELKETIAKARQQIKELEDANAK